MEAVKPGVYAALTTPFVREAISVARFRKNIERYNRSGLTGYVVLGSTGEAVFLDDEESARLVAEAKAAASSGRTLIAGASRESARLTVSVINRLAGLGADAALVKPPHYYKARMTRDALKLFYERVADEARIPVLIYNIPQNTGLPVEPPLVVELSRHPNIIGIKDSSGALSNLAETKPAASPGFLYLVGAGSVFLPGLAMGADGGILAMAAAVPDLCVRLYRLFLDNRLKEARDLQLSLVPLNKALTQTMGIPATKHALDILGYFGGGPRSPLLPLDAQGKRQVRKLLRDLGLPG
jgi:4-hydroxy-2-oxoglutarate aldolase